MTFYGGRQISEEDLEKALLVGMTPHEKRRLQKKKGFSFQHSRGIIPSDAEEKNTVSMSTSATLKVLEVDTVHGSCTSEAEASLINQDKDVFAVKDADLGNSIDSYLRIDEKASAGVEKNMNSEISLVSNTTLVSVVNGDGNYERRSTPNGSVDDKIESCVSNDFHSTSKRKHKSKHSLLGHGPHGKQVVDHLLKEYGEDGISQFCQRWRQVFVETVHPRFLPGGWDITHRYVLPKIIVMV